MTRSDEIEVQRLIERYLSRSMTEREADRWLEYSLNEPELVDNLLDHLALDDMLRGLARGGYADSRMAQTLVEVIGRRHRAWPLRHPVWASAVCLLLVAVAALFGQARTRRPESPSVAVVEPQIVIKEAAKPACARLDAAVDVAWTGSEPVEIGDELPGGGYEIGAGFLRLRFLSGATVLVEGPARFELVSPDRLACSRGRLDVVVPPEAVGFRVDLPETGVIDLGTVFSVLVTETGSEVQVHQGRVALTETSFARQILEAGRAIRTRTDGSRTENPSFRFYHADRSRLESVQERAEAASERFTEHYIEEKTGRKVATKALLPDCFLVAQRTGGTGEPDNSLSAFRKALELGADACELDVAAAKDGTLFVIHPGNAVRDKVPFSELSVEEIKRLDIRTKKEREDAERIPTLDEALEFFRAESTCPIVVDVFDAKAVPAVVDTIERHGLADRVVFTGRTPKPAKALKELRPSLCVGLCFDSKQYAADTSAETIIAEAASVGADFIKLEYPLITADRIAALRASGLPVWAYTIDTPEALNFCRQVGVAGVLSCRSDLLVNTERKPVTTRPEQEKTADITD